MGFAQIWSSNKAYNIETQKIETLNGNIEAELLNTQSIFYILPAQLPYGLTDGKPGQLVVCEGHNGGVAIKAWKFNDGDWQRNFLGGGVHLVKFSHLIAIQSPNDGYGGYGIWLPTEKESWREPGQVKWYARIGNDYSHVADYPDVPFAEFMATHYPVPSPVEV